MKRFFSIETKTDNIITSRHLRTGKKSHMIIRQQLQDMHIHINIQKYVMHDSF